MVFEFEIFKNYRFNKLKKKGVRSICQENKEK